MTFDYFIVVKCAKITPDNIVTENYLNRIFSANCAFPVIINNESCDW